MTRPIKHASQVGDMRNEATTEVVYLLNEAASHQPQRSTEELVWQFEQLSLNAHCNMYDGHNLPGVHINLIEEINLTLPNLTPLLSPPTR